MKVNWKPGTMIYPLPAVMISCGSEPSEYNIITASWVGTICTNPPMCYISIRPERYSYPILKKNMEFVINLTTRQLAYATDWCGVNSGKDHYKYEEMKLTPGKATLVNSPTIEESPLCIECRVQEIMALGSHDMFIAEVINVQADDKYLDPETGAFDMQKADLLAYSHGKYYGLGEFIGKFGWSVKKTSQPPKGEVKKGSNKFPPFRELGNKLGVLILIFCFICQVANSQQEIREEDKIFNFGATIGLKSVLPVVNSLTIDDIDADNIQVIYRVGYHASIFCRINVDRLFLQPSFSWYHASGEISFNLPSEDNDLIPVGQNSLKTKYESLEMPVLVGYKLVKEGPYGLSLMVGPKIKYNYNTKYDFQISGSQNRFSKESNLFDISIVTGVGVSIWRLFFDFSYEFGLNRIDSDFKNQNPNEPLINTITINQHVNVMSFSLGLLF